MRALFQNLWLKLIALSMGLLLWFHVATEKIYNYELKLPVSGIDLRDHHTLAGIPPDSVVVSVTAKGKQLLQTDWRHQGVRINVSRLTAGEHTVQLSSENVHLTQPTKNVSLDRVLYPSSVEFDVDVESRVQLPVQPDMTIIPEDGFALAGIPELLPARVTVYGPKSVLRAIHQVKTEPFELKGIRSTVTVPLKLQSPQGHRMRLDPDSVVATVSVVPVKSRVYENVPVVIYNAPAGSRVESVPPTVRIELTGPPTDIALLNKNALTVSADFRLATATGMAPIKVDCPANFAVKGQSADSVHIEVVTGADARY